MRFAVDRIARRHERADVGDRVEHAETITATLGVQRLVEVHRALRIQRDQRQVGAIERG